MSRTQKRPSYRTGFARCASKSAYPKLWKGLVGAWCPSLGPSGDRLLDWSGRQNHGTLTDMTLGTAWADPGCLIFDGTDDYVRSTNMPVVTAYTWSAWAKINGIGGLFSFDVVFGMGGNKELRMSGAGTAPEFSGFGVSLTSPDAITAGRWYHWLMTINAAGAVILYVDGNEKASGAGTFSSQGANSTIGQRNNTDAQTWNGGIDDVLVYGRALNPSEVILLYQLGPGGIYTPRRRSVFSVPGTVATGSVFRSAVLQSNIIRGIAS